jgi:hypothetical protein
MNLAPRDEICSPGVNTLNFLEEWRGEQRISPPGDKIHPWGTTSPLGAEFAPRDEVKNGPQHHAGNPISEFSISEALEIDLKPVQDRVARFFFTQYTKTVKKIPTYQNITK